MAKLEKKGSIEGVEEITTTETTRARGPEGIVYTMTEIADEVRERVENLTKRVKAAGGNEKDQEQATAISNKHKEEVGGFLTKFAKEEDPDTVAELRNAKMILMENSPETKQTQEMYENGITRLSVDLKRKRKKYADHEESFRSAEAEIKRRTEAPESINYETSGIPSAPNAENYRVTDETEYKSEDLKWNTAEDPAKNETPYVFDETTTAPSSIDYESKDSADEKKQAGTKTKGSKKSGDSVDRFFKQTEDISKKRGREDKNKEPKEQYGDKFLRQTEKVYKNQKDSNVSESEITADYPNQIQENEIGGNTIEDNEIKDTISSEEIRSTEPSETIPHENQGVAPIQDEAPVNQGPNRPPEDPMERIIRTAGVVGRNERRHLERTAEDVGEIRFARFARNRIMEASNYFNDLVNSGAFGDDFNIGNINPNAIRRVAGAESRRRGGLFSFFKRILGADQPIRRVVRQIARAPGTIGYRTSELFNNIVSAGISQIERPIARFRACRAATQFEFALRQLESGRAINDTQVRLFLEKARWTHAHAERLSRPIETRYQ